MESEKETKSNLVELRHIEKERLQRDKIELRKVLNGVCIYIVLQFMNELEFSSRKINE